MIQAKYSRLFNLGEMSCFKTFIGSYMQHWNTNVSQSIKQNWFIITTTWWSLRKLLSCTMALQIMLKLVNIRNTIV